MEGETIANAAASSSSSPSGYEYRKEQDWFTFVRYLEDLNLPLIPSHCNGAHVIEFLKYLDKFGKTKVHGVGCPSYGKPNPSGKCDCPLNQGWRSLEVIVGRLRVAFEEIGGGLPESNIFTAEAIKNYIKEVRETQTMARGISYDKKKRKTNSNADDGEGAGGSGGGAAAATMIYSRHSTESK